LASSWRLVSGSGRCHRRDLRTSFHAFTVLGGFVLFTATHFLLTIVYGVVIVSAIHGAARAPSLIIALVFGFVVLEIAFAMVTVLLSNLGLEISRGSGSLAEA